MPHPFAPPVAAHGGGPLGDQRPAAGESGRRAPFFFSPLPPPPRRAEAAIADCIRPQVKSKYVQASADERRRSSAPHSPVSRVTTTVFPGLVNAPAKLELSALGASNLALHNITLHSEPPVSEDTAARAVLPALPPR